MGQRLGITPDEARERMASEYALHRISTAEDVANAVVFLASDQARWITGQDLMVDGGYGLLNVFDASPYGRNLAATR
jgi:NAD(P)-dependent dehydrogenase (short-subunit alcohol dehydrogenase family)